MTYAIIKVAGKQYRVREGERLLVDRLHEDEGATIAPAVLLVGGDGAPQLEPGDGAVTATVLGEVKGPKIRIGKYKKRTGYRRHTGFRASLTQIRIESIGGGKPSRAAAKAKDEPREAGRPREGDACRIRGLDRRGDQGGVLRLEPADARCRARVRAGTCEPQGRSRGSRVGAGREGGRFLMAHKKGLGSSRNGRDSESKRLGVKVFAGQPVKTGMIIVRQRGTKFRPGPGAGLGRDDTIFALRNGTVEFRRSGDKRFISVAAAD